MTRTDFFLRDLVLVVLYQTAEVGERDAYAVNLRVRGIGLVLLYRVSEVSEG
jgi:hypothetical protein